ncbi:MAG: FRG domain-containing protein [Gemmataceae bacterium]
MSGHASECVIHTLSEYLGHLRDLKLTDQPQAHVRWWFRGQPDQRYQLVPGVYRAEFPTADESARLTLEQHLYQDFRVLSGGLLPSDVSDVGLYFLQQHYGLPTRLLDWTTNPLAALYFAVNTGPDTVGAVDLMDVFRLAPTQGAEAEFQGVVTSAHPRLREWLRPVIDGGNPADFAGYVVPIRPVHFDTRVRLQRGCFTLHVPDHPRLTRRENDSLRRLTVPPDAKAAIYQELKLSGVDEFSIFGDLENLAVSLRSAYRL